jgi:triacylglycerol esterase/lipase EstA (alpha/beta hydrolase family)
MRDVSQAGPHHESSDASPLYAQQGGLDGRYLISKLKPRSFKVVSLTTIATPHRGSPFADYFIDNIIGREYGIPG